MNAINNDGKLREDELVQLKKTFKELQETLKAKDEVIESLRTG